MQKTPEVSVIVPVYNRRLVVRETVECLLRQSLPPREIIVVDDGSTDGTAQSLTERFGNRISVLSKRNGGPASARNCGIREAAYDFIAFTDSDCLPDEDWLLELLRAFDSPNVAGVGGAVRGAAPGLLSEYADTVAHFDPYVERGEVKCLVTGNACFRRETLLEAGLFDECFRRPGGEDSELSVRIRSLGYELRFAPDAVVLHHHKQSLPDLLRTMSNYGEGNYLLSELWPEWTVNIKTRKHLLRGALPVRHLFRRCLAFRREHGLARAVLFALIENYTDFAHTWGYLRAARRRGGHARVAARELIQATQPGRGGGGRDARTQSPAPDKTQTAS